MEASSIFIQTIWGDLETTNEIGMFEKSRQLPVDYRKTSFDRLSTEQSENITYLGKN